MQVVGIKEAKGEFEGRKYHNLNIHCLVPAENNDIGQLSEIVKIKVDNLTNVFGKTMSDDDFVDLIGEEIECGYNRYGQCNYVRIIAQSVQA